MKKYFLAIFVTLGIVNVFGKTLYITGNRKLTNFGSWNQAISLNNTSYATITHKDGMFMRFHGAGSKGIFFAEKDVLRRYLMFISGLNGNIGIGTTPAIDAEQQLNSKYQEYQNAVRKAQEESAKLQNEIMTPVYEKINKKIKEWGEANNYNTIWVALPGGNILYGSEGSDITNQLVEYINENN